MAKILVLHAGNSNKGSQALVISLVNTVKEYIPSAEFSFMGEESNQNQFSIKKQLAIKPLKNLHPWAYLVNCIIFNLFSKISIKYPISEKSRLFDYYDADLIINTGGDHLSGEKFGLSSLLNISYGILLNKPVVLYAESLGYYQNPLFKFIANTVLNHTQLITVREKLSKKYLEENNISNPKIYLTADSAFNLEPEDPKNLKNILMEEGIENNKKPLICINPSGLIYKYKKSGDAEDPFDTTVSIFSQVIDEIIEKLGGTIILMPHVYSKSVDDTKIIEAIYNNIKNKHGVKCILKEYNAKELKGIIGMCDLFMGARMHATIAATSMCVPSVGIAYSHKMHGVIGHMLELEDYILNIDDITPETLKEKIYKCWNEREVIKNKLKEKIPKVKQNAKLNGKYVKELLDSL